MDGRHRPPRAADGRRQPGMLVRSSGRGRVSKEPQCHHGNYDGCWIRLLPRRLNVASPFQLRERCCQSIAAANQDEVIRRGLTGTVACMNDRCRRQGFARMMTRSGWRLWVKRSSKPAGRCQLKALDLYRRPRTLASSQLPSVQGGPTGQCLVSGQRAR